MLKNNNKILLRKRLASKQERLEKIKVSKIMIQKIKEPKSIISYKRSIHNKRAAKMVKGPII